MRRQAPAVDSSTLIGSTQGQPEQAQRESVGCWRLILHKIILFIPDEFTLSELGRPVSAQSFAGPGLSTSLLRALLRATPSSFARWGVLDTTYYPLVYIYVGADPGVSGILFASTTILAFAEYTYVVYYGEQQRAHWLR